MGASLIDLRSRLRVRLNELVPAAWSDSDLSDMLNEATREVARRTLYLETVTPFANTVGQNRFNHSVVDLRNCLKVNRLEWTPSGGNLKYSLEYRPYQNMDSIWWTSQDITQSIPEYFMMWGVGDDLNLQVYPKCSQAGTFNLFYWRFPLPMTGDDDDSELPTGWEDLAVTYAEYLAMLRDRDDRWQQVFRKFDSDVGLMSQMANSHSIHGTQFEVSGYGGGLGWLYGQDYY